MNVQGEAVWGFFKFQAIALKALIFYYFALQSYIIFLIGENGFVHFIRGLLSFFVIFRFREVLRGMCFVVASLTFLTFRHISEQLLRHKTICRKSKNRGRMKKVTWNFYGNTQNLKCNTDFFTGCAPDFSPVQWLKNKKKRIISPDYPLRQCKYTTFSARKQIVLKSWI